MIVFENKGVIPIEAFSTFGLNAKPMTKNPIGFFGTGLKYAISVTLRLGGKFILWRSGYEYQFYTSSKKFRDKEFEFVRMRKRASVQLPWRYEKLPFTLELGKNWKPWMAVRELESNVRDENGFSYLMSKGDNVSDRPIFNKIDHTIIVIECPEMEEVYNDLNTVLLSEDLTKIDEQRGIEIYDMPSRFIYYRGIRIQELNKSSMFTYNCTSFLSLTEDRTPLYTFLLNMKILDSLSESKNVHLLNRVLEDSSEDFWESGLDWDHLNRKPSDVFYSTLSNLVVGNSNSVTPRALAYHRKVTVPDPEELINISLTLRQWQHIIEFVEDGDIIQEIADEFNNLGLKLEESGPISAAESEEIKETISRTMEVITESQNVDEAEIVVLEEINEGELRTFDQLQASDEEIDYSKLEISDDELTKEALDLDDEIPF